MDKEPQDNKVNLQNIPSHNKDIRKMFVATQGESIVTTDTDCFEVDRWCEVECVDGWKLADNIIVGDTLIDTDSNQLVVSKVSNGNGIVYIYFGDTAC